MNNNMNDKLKELRRGYLYKLRETFSQFKSLNEENPLNVQEIYVKVHTISGTSGLYGLMDLSEKSTEFEIYLKSIKDNLEVIDEEELKLRFSDFIKYLEGVLVGD